MDGVLSQEVLGGFSNVETMQPCAEAPETDGGAGAVLVLLSSK